MNVNQILIYSNILKDEAIDIFRKILNESNEAKVVSLVFDLQRKILSGRDKVTNWKSYIIALLMSDENIFSLQCENCIPIKGKLYKLALEDLIIIREIYSFNWSEITKGISRSTLFDDDMVSDEYKEIQNMFNEEKFSNENILDELIKYFNQNGVGLFARKYVFKWDGSLKTVKNFDVVKFNDLIGYERQIKELKYNTHLFITKGTGNNVLLYGDRGTGKSSSVKALVDCYKSEGLRIIEIKKNQLNKIPKVIDVIKTRNYKFIIFIDDLSFEEFETDYKDFKGILEGSFERRPDNVLIYVTSNRRHLIRESFKNREEDIHSNETVEEKLSLFDRFGISILYNQPKEELFYNMVIKLADRRGIKIPQDELLKQAQIWRTVKGSKSGRIAQQLIDSLM